MIPQPSAYEIIMILHELHQRGYEQLRLFSGMSPNGCAWRWEIYPKILMWDDNSFECRGYGTSFECPHGSASESKPQGRPLITADEFIKGKEDLFELAKAKDGAYVEWFGQIVRHAEQEDFPIAYADYFSAKEWKFMSGDPLSYPPFTRSAFDELTEKAIEYARAHDIF